MTALFVSLACDYCDGIKTVSAPYRGFAAWPLGKTGACLCYVFPDAAQAQTWMDQTSLDMTGYAVREIVSEHPFEWQQSTGTIEAITIARRPYEIFPDHRFPPAPSRGFLAHSEPTTSDSLVAH